MTNYDYNNDGKIDDNDYRDYLDDNWYEKENGIGYDDKATNTKNTNINRSSKPILPLRTVFFVLGILFLGICPILGIIFLVMWFLSLG